VIDQSQLSTLPVYHSTILLCVVNFEKPANNIPCRPMPIPYVMHYVSTPSSSSKAAPALFAVSKLTEKTCSRLPSTGWTTGQNCGSTHPWTPFASNSNCFHANTTCTWPLPCRCKATLSSHFQPSGSEALGHQGSHRPLKCHRISNCILLNSCKRRYPLSSSKARAEPVC